jgi:hypothetical protein
MVTPSFLPFRFWPAQRTEIFMRAGGHCLFELLPHAIGIVNLSRDDRLSLGPLLVYAVPSPHAKVFRDEAAGN